MSRGPIFKPLIPNALQKKQIAYMHEITESGHELRIRLGYRRGGGAMHICKKCGEILERPLSKCKTRTEIENAKRIDE